MSSRRFGSFDLLLVAVAIAVVLANAWLVFGMWQDGADADRVAENVEEERQSLRRFQLMDDITGPQNELRQLQAALAKGAPQTLPTNVDVLKLVYGLVDLSSNAEVKIVSIRAREARDETIDSVLFQLVGYEIGLDGNPVDMLAMVRRVDTNELPSLTIPALLLTKGETRWSLRSTVAGRILAPVQPEQPRAQAAPSPAAGSTPAKAGR